MKDSKISFKKNQRSIQMKNARIMQNDNFGTNFIGNLEKKSWLKRSEWYIDAIPSGLVDNNGQGSACWGLNQLSYNQQMSLDDKFYILKEGTPQSEIMEKLNKSFGTPSNFVKLDEYTPYAYTCRSYLGNNFGTL
jgi:hypothetical protein